MAWLRIGDTLHSCPQVVALGGQRLPAMGVYLLAYSWAAEHCTGGQIGDLVPVTQLRMWHLDSDLDLDVLVRALERVGLVARRRSRHRQWGECLVFITDDTLAHALTAEEVAINRAPKIPADVRLRVIARDGDQCRWDGTIVVPAHRKGGRRRQIDHVVNDGGHTLDNLVVACSFCNGLKADGTLLESLDRTLPRHPSGLLLTPGERGDAPYYDPATLPSLIEAGLVRPSRPTDGTSRAPSRPVDDLRARGAAASGDDASTGPARSDTDLSPIGVPFPGNAGTGRAGSGRGPAPPQARGRPAGPGPAARGGRRHGRAR